MVGAKTGTLAERPGCRIRTSVGACATSTGCSALRTVGRLGFGSVALAVHRHAGHTMGLNRGVSCTQPERVSRDGVVRCDLLGDCGLLWPPPLAALPPGDARRKRCRRGGGGLNPRRVVPMSSVAAAVAPAMEAATAVLGPWLDRVETGAGGTDGELTMLPWLLLLGLVRHPVPVVPNAPQAACCPRLSGDRGMPSPSLS
mmetsp:Transcript_17441/g.52695  ORF Transcript_17441/g.52695 Transcript_17441/m.52695 type:complete len:200 (+) Transcript_17441:286-885(+)